MFNLTIMVTYLKAYRKLLTRCFLLSQITSRWTVCSILFSGWQQKKHQHYAYLPFVEENLVVTGTHKGPVIMGKLFPSHDVIMNKHNCCIFIAVLCVAWMFIPAWQTFQSMNIQLVMYTPTLSSATQVYRSYLHSVIRNVINHHQRVSCM